TTPPKARELLRSIYLKQHGLSYHHSIAMFVSERFLDVLVMACLASLTVFQFGDYGTFVLLASLLMVALLFLIKSTHFKSLLDFAHDRVRWKRLQGLLTHLRSLLHNAQQLLRYRLLSLGLLIGIVAWAIQGVAFYYLLQLLGWDTSLLAAVGIYAISLLAGAATFIPGGVGGTEVVMAVLLAASGADTSIAVAAPLISRLTTLWFAVAIGLLANTLIGRQALREPQ
ncbi:MAG: lysylphosphatidylglycerol synthase transmembrane domain-containing protein, partial [Gammaproteobacteria bacterium]